jgi:hypothetical protein
MEDASAVVRRRKATAAAAGAIAAGATNAAYVFLVAGNPTPGVVPFLLVYISLIAAAAAVSAVLIVKGESASADVVMITAAAGSAALGFVGIFSIGIGLLIAAGLLLLATFGFEPHARRPGDWKAPLAGVVGAIAVLVAIFTISGAFSGS